MSSENMVKYRISVLMNRENFFWVVVDNGKLIKNPTKEELYGTKLKMYNKTNICFICREENERDGKLLTDSSILYPGNARLEIDKNGMKTDKWVCHKHGSNNLRRSLTRRRVGDQDPNSNNAKGDRGEELLCRWKGYTNLNKKNDNYTYRRDCIDDKTGEYYQVRIAYYNHVSRYWNQGLPQNSIIEGYRFKELFLFCISKYGRTVERIYEIPEKEIYDTDTKKGRKGIAIVKDIVLKGCGWYEKYRIIDKEVKIVNEIWKQIIEEL